MILKKNFKKAILLTIAFIGLIYFLEDNSSINFFSPEFLLTFLMYLIPVSYTHLRAHET